MYHKSAPKTQANPQHLTDACTSLHPNPVGIRPSGNLRLQPVLANNPTQGNSSNLVNTNLAFFKAHYLETGEFYPNLRKKIENYNNNRRLNPRLPTTTENEGEITVLSMQQQS